VHCTKETEAVNTSEQDNKEKKMVDFEPDRRKILRPTESRVGQAMSRKRRQPIAR
jgi:hypothetical protein